MLFRSVSQSRYVDIIVDVYAKDVHFACPVYKNFVTYNPEFVDINDVMMDDIYSGNFDKFFELCMKNNFDRKKIWNFKVNKRNRVKYENFLNAQDYKLFCMGIIKPLDDEVILQGKDESNKEKDKPKEKEKEKEKAKEKVRSKPVLEAKTAEKGKKTIKEKPKSKVVQKPKKKVSDKPHVNKRNNKEKGVDPSPSNALFQPEVNLTTAYVLAPFKNIVSEEYVRCIMNENIGSLKQLFNRYVNVGVKNITSGDVVLIDSATEIEGYGIAELTWMFTFGCGGYSMKLTDITSSYKIFDLRRYFSGIPQSGLNPIYVKDEGTTSTITAPRYSNFPFFVIRSNAMFYEEVHFLSEASVENPKGYQAYFRFSDDFVLWGRNFLPFVADVVTNLDIEQPAILGDIAAPKPKSGWFVDRSMNYDEFFRYNRMKFSKNNNSS